jgi:tripartite ATP-independent transporter DctM subunit
VTIGLLTTLLFGSIVVLLIVGTPIAFALGAVAILFSLFVVGPKSLNIMPAQSLGVMQTFVFTAVPLFIVMAAFLERSGIADELYGFMYGLLGRIRGGLAVGTVIICTIFAAMAGISGAATVTMGLIALPSMFKRGYDKRMVMGCIQAGGALGILIPPSITMILYGVMAGESVGRLFAGGVFSGLLLATLFIAYILIRCRLQPNLGPSLPREERIALFASIKQSRALILPVSIVAAVIGMIFSGIATPTEAAAVGAFGAIISVIVKRKLTWRLTGEAIRDTVLLTGMLGWIAICALWIASVYQAIGGQKFVGELISGLEVNRWIILAGMQLIYIFLGMFMDVVGIIFVTIPVFVPIIKLLGFDPLWFGILFVMNMEMAYLTPPFGINLFYMKGLVPPGITMGDIYRSVIPFVLLQLLGLVIVAAVPPIATFLPNLLFGKVV